MRRLFLSIVLVLCLAPIHAMADPPTELDYQGKILVDDFPLNGDAYFKFALSDSGAVTNHWANDGTTSGEPTDAVTNHLFNGVFNVSLGGAGMTAIDRRVFSNGGALYLRVWFSDDNITFNELLPRQKMLSHGFAVNADQVDGLDAADLIASAATNVVLGGDVIGNANTNHIAAGVIVDADINNNAAIAPTKIAGTALTEASVFGGAVTGTYQNLTLTFSPLTESTVFGGDVSGLYSNLTLNTSALPLTDTGTVGMVQMSGGFGATAPYRAIDDNDTRLNAFGVVNTVTSTSPNSVLSIVGTNGITVSNTGPGTLTVSAAPPLVLSNTIYVALNGTPMGPGTIDRPYDTAQAGYDAAATNFPGQASAVVLMGGGSYGPLNMNRGTVHVLGESRSELADLTVTFGIPTPPLFGKQRVENVVVTGPAFVQPTGTGGAFIKFHNCRFLEGLVIDDSFVELQDCAVQNQSFISPAISVGLGGGPITEVGLYQSAMVSRDPTPAAGTLFVGPGVLDFEVIGCSIVNEDGFTGPAVTDYTAGIAPGTPLHLYSHNVIKGPTSGLGAPAFADPGLPPIPSFSFVQNTVQGDVGSPGPGGRPQHFSNNTIYGLINFPVAGAALPMGWVQAGGVGPGVDGSGNVEHFGGGGVAGPAVLPSHWDD